MPKVKYKLKFDFPGFAHFKNANLNAEEDFVKREHNKLTELVVSTMYLFLITGLSLAVLMELKMEYKIDIFRGIGTPFDEVYSTAKNVFSNEEPLPQ